MFNSWVSSFLLSLWNESFILFHFIRYLSFSVFIFTSTFSYFYEIDHSFRKRVPVCYSQTKDVKIENFEPFLNRLHFPFQPQFRLDFVSFLFLIHTFPSIPSQSLAFSPRSVDLLVSIIWIYR